MPAHHGEVRNGGHGRRVEGEGGELPATPAQGEEPHRQTHPRAGGDDVQLQILQVLKIQVQEQEQGQGG